MKVNLYDHSYSCTPSVVDLSQIDPSGSYEVRISYQNSKDAMFLLPKNPSDVIVAVNDINEHTFDKVRRVDFRRLR